MTYPKRAWRTVNKQSGGKKVDLLDETLDEESGFLGRGQRATDTPRGCSSAHQGGIMAREDRPHSPDKPKRQPEPDREGQRRGSKEAGEQSRDWPGDKEMDPVRQGEKRK